jgi:glutamate synthase (NADPH/NADH) small chain
MDCGIPFCHQGCPLGNLIPEWNDLLYREDFAEAIDRLHATNNFPEFTGRLCPAPCETSCTLGIADDPVSIEYIEKTIVEEAFARGLVNAVHASHPTNRSVAIVGSGPSGLAAAQQLARAGHRVTVYERADRPGGLLRYGIPEFKMEKSVLDRRLAQLLDEGVTFQTGINVGVDISLEELRSSYDAVLLTIGSTIARDLPIPGRELTGIYQAMEYLPIANRVALNELPDHPFSAQGKAVVIIGGGDTGADCLGTAHRQGARAVTQIEILPKPSLSRPESNPWPTWPTIFRTSSAHEEGGVRAFSLNTECFEGDGRVERLRVHEVVMDTASGRPQFVKVPGSEQVIEADLVLLALGFVGPETTPIDPDHALSLNDRGSLSTDERFMTSVEGVFAAGDARRGQSLIVWAIAEGRSAAKCVDAYLTGSSDLPQPINPSTAALTV